VALGLCYVFVAFEMVAGMGVSDLTTGLAPTIAAITLWFDPVFFFGPWWTIPSFGALFAALVCCVLAIAASGGVDRQRAVWTLVPFAVLYCVWQVFGPAFEFLSYAAQLSVNYMLTFAFMTAPLALTYVALNRRLIDIGFVLNRTVVFTFVSIIVVAAFVLVEWLASEWFAGTSHQTSALIGMVVALALGLSLRYIHRYVDRFVDHVFFRKRHEDEVALRRFAHEAAFISDRSTLLSRAIQTVRRHTDADDATILIRNGAADYAPLGEAGRSVDENDPAFVVLRAWGKPVNIHAIEETKVRGEVAFPIVSRGDLLGALVCGPKRDGETYAPDESEALFALAHGVGTALGTLPHDDAAAGSAAEKLDLILDKLQSLERRSPG
jgi:hypothetical protein